MVLSRSQFWQFIQAQKQAVAGNRRRRHDDEVRSPTTGVEKTTTASETGRAMKPKTVENLEPKPPCSNFSRHSAASQVGLTHPKLFLIAVITKVLLFD